jgi:pimeloyl-ACP methyl ester carboxylesterase
LSRSRRPARFCHVGGHAPYARRVTIYALVHGAWHGAWCWEKVTRLLLQAGHDVVAPDLPSDDGSADFDTYADTMCGALKGCDDDVVVVGHSLGGPAATLVAARRPVRHLVYLCAVVPEAGLSLVDQGVEQTTPEFARGWVKGLSEPDEQGRTVWVDFDFVRKVFYADCDEPTVAAAIAHLRPQAAYPWTLPCSLTEPPSVPCTYVVCAEDRIVDPEWSRRIAHRIGADVVELPGSHSPLLSRPSAVAEVLVRVADKE